MRYYAHVKNNTGDVQASIISNDKSKVIEWMSKQKKARKMRDKRPFLFRKSHIPIYRSRTYFTMTCNFLILKRI